MMKNVTFDGFDWDKGNETKNLNKHNVSKLETEQLFLNQPLVYPEPIHKKMEQRYFVFGETNTGRHLVCIFTYRMKNKKRFIRPISIRPMSHKERGYYEKETS